MKRNYGIDLLRMAAMGFVAALHIIGIGGIITGSALLSGQFLTAQLLRIALLCAVNCYALISGFVGWEKKAKLSSLVSLWLKAVVFCIAVTAFFAGSHELDWRTWLNAVLPVTTGQYWYLTAYAGLFVLMPVLNFAVQKMPQKELRLTLAGILVLFCLLPISPLTDAFYLHDGYSALWLAVMYLLGGYLGKYGVLNRISTGKWLAVFFGAVLFAWAPRMAALFIRPYFWQIGYGNILIEYTSPTIVLAAAALLALFSRITLPGWAERAVRSLSPHAFGVYLLHAHPLMFRFLLENRFSYLGTAPIPELIGTVVLWSAVICAAGLAADALVSLALRITGIEQLLKKLP